MALIPLKLFAIENMAVDQKRLVEQKKILLNPKIEYIEGLSFIRWDEIKEAEAYIIYYSQERDKKYDVAGITERNFFKLESKYGYYKIKPVGTNDFNYELSKPVLYSIRAKDDGLNLKENIKKWGLGEKLKLYIANDREYNWYVSQGNTGSYSNINCGPTVATMATMWSNKDFSRTVKEARNTYKSSGGYWTTEDVVNYLNLYNVKNKTKSIGAIEDMLFEIDRGNIIILCIDTKLLPLNCMPEERTGRYYSFGGGHFIIIKGYAQLDEKIYFEAYDPIKDKYKDEGFKGINRYYLAGDLIKAIEKRWAYGIVIKN